MANKYLNWMIFGALAGIILGLVVPWVIGQLVSATGIAGIQFSTYTFNVREQLKTVASCDIATGMCENPVAAWAAKLLGVSLPGSWWVTALLMAVGLGAAVTVVAWLYDMFLGRILEMVIPGKFKLVTIVMLATLLISIAIENSYPVFEFVPLLFMVLTGFLAVFIMKWAYKLFRMELPN